MEVDEDLALPARADATTTNIFLVDNAALVARFIELRAACGQGEEEQKADQPASSPVPRGGVHSVTDEATVLRLAGERAAARDEGRGYIRRGSKMGVSPVGSGSDSDDDADDNKGKRPPRKDSYTDETPQLLQGASPAASPAASAASDAKEAVEQSYETVQVLCESTWALAAQGALPYGVFCAIIAALLRLHEQRPAAAVSARAVKWLFTHFGRPGNGLVARLLTCFVDKDTGEFVPWFHGHVRQQDVHALLTEPRAFMMRWSQSNKCLVLSFRDGAVQHWPVKITAEGLFSADKLPLEGPPLRHICDLVRSLHESKVLDMNKAVAPAAAVFCAAAWATTPAATAAADVALKERTIRPPSSPAGSESALSSQE